MTLDHQRIRHLHGVIDGTAWIATLPGGATGAWLAHCAMPDHWSHTTQVLIAGIAAVLAAATVHDGIKQLTTPIRRMLTRNTPPPTLTQALQEISYLTEVDAARKAAFYTNTLLEGRDSFLCDPDMWRGYEDGEATLSLTPGIVLHYRHGDVWPEYTLLSAEKDDPARITDVAEIRHYLAAAAADLPLTRNDAFLKTA